MGSDSLDIPESVLSAFRGGGAIPAHPLALTAKRTLDTRHQRALTRYYIDAGVVALAVGVHGTQFAIREAGLYERVLSLAADTAASSGRPLMMIAGLVGDTRQALSEAEVARGLGYHAGLLSLASLKQASEDELIEHCRSIAEVIPLVGFYLQPVVGGRDLSVGFWQRFATIERVIGIKVAPFDRYRTLAVLRGVALAKAERRIALYTGNDDSIVVDLIQPWDIRRGDENIRMHFVGGLLGHWSVWTRTAVELMQRVQRTRAAGEISPDLLALGGRITDCNAAFFDTANAFRGCIAGCHEILRRQGLLQGIWCLDPEEGLSPGQSDEINRVCREHADLSDDSFVAANLERWLA